jgi:type III secretory pathway lipoprotein EscJ
MLRQHRMIPQAGWNSPFRRVTLAAMSDANLVIVHTFLNEPEAELAKGALQSAGIDAIIQADDVGGMRHHLAMGSGGFKVLVREDDAAVALEILEPSELPRIDSV